MYGMGEKTIISCQPSEIRHECKEHKKQQGYRLRGKYLDGLKDYVEVPSFEDVASDKEAYAKSYKAEYMEQDPTNGKQ